MFVNDPSLCDSLANASLRDECRTNLKYNTKDKSLCDKMETDEQRYACRISFVSSFDEINGLCEAAAAANYAPESSSVKSNNYTLSFSRDRAEFIYCIAKTLNNLVYSANKSCEDFSSFINGQGEKFLNDYNEYIDKTHESRTCLADSQEAY